MLACLLAYGIIYNQRCVQNLVEQLLTIFPKSSILDVRLHFDTLQGTENYDTKVKNSHETFLVHFRLICKQLAKDQNVTYKKFVYLLKSIIIMRGILAQSDLFGLSNSVNMPYRKFYMKPKHQMDSNIPKIQAKNKLRTKAGLLYRRT